MFKIILSFDLDLFGFTVYKPSKVISSHLPTSPLGQDMTQGQFLSGV